MPQGEVVGAPRPPWFALARQRLHAHVDASSPVRILRAPAGAGKTTLLTMWVHERQSPARCVWITLDAASGTSPSFWAKAAQLIAESGTGVPDELSAAASERDGTVRSRMLLRALVALDAGLVLVLDEADHIDDALATELLWLVDHCDGFELVLASRDSTAFESIDVKVRVGPTVIGASELLFTADEVATLARQAGLPENVTQPVLAATGGVPFLVRAVIVALGDPNSGAEELEHRIAEFVEVANEELLHTEFARSLPTEAVGTTRSYAQWLLENDHPYRSFAVAIETGDLAHASRVARIHLLDLLGAHGRAVLGLLAPIPRLTLRRHPLLALMLALIHNARGHRLRAIEYLALTAVGARTRRTRADPHERALLLAVESAALRVAGRASAALQVAQKFSTAVDEIPPDALNELQNAAPVMFAHVGISFLYGGDGTRALDAFERASSFARPGEEHELHPLALRAGTHALRGEMLTARDLVTRIRSRTWPEASINGYRGAFVHLAEALLAIEDLDFARARERLEVVRPHLATLEHWPLFAHVFALCDLGLGQPARSDLTLKRELRDRRRASISSLTGAMLSATRATLLLADGKATEAAEVLRAAPPTPHVRVARARVALLSGEPERVIASVAGGDVDALAPRYFAELQLLHAAAAHQLGHDEAARTALGSAMAALSEYGMRHPLTLVRRTDRVALAGLAAPGERTVLLDEGIPELLPHDVTLVALTQREHAVLQRLALGGTVAEIAAELHVSVNTLKTQLRAVYRKLGVNDRESALVAATRHGLLR